MCFIAESITIESEVDVITGLAENNVTRSEANEMGTEQDFSLDERFLGEVGLKAANNIIAFKAAVVFQLVGLLFFYLQMANKQQEGSTI